MGIFDGVSSSTGYSFTKPKVNNTSGEKEPLKIKTLANEDTRVKRAAALKKHNDTIDTLANKRKLSNEATIFSGMRHENGNIKVNTPNAFAGKPQLAAELNKAKNVFMENLTNALFINKINIINCEALDVEGSLKDSDKFKELNYERCLSMFNDIRSYKDFDKVVAENKVPGFVCELWSLAREAAEAECNRRFDFNSTFETTGYSEEKVHDYIQNEMNCLFITNESLNEYFEKQTAMIIAENSDVIDEIKSKVTGELDNYKKTAQHIADIKKAVREKIDSADSVDGANGKSDNPDDESNKDNPEKTDTGSEDKNDDSDQKTTDDDLSNSDENTSDGEEKTTETSSEEKESEETETGSSESNDDKPNTDAADNTEPEKQDGDKGGESNENGDLPENQEELQKISPKVTQEIEDAAAFAESWSHTFNTGDEKFETLRKRFSQEFTAALNDNDIDKVNEIRANVIATKNRLEQINNNSDNKYGETLKKFVDLDTNIKFEFGKRAGKAAKVAEESKTVFESLVINIAKRKKAAKGIALEDTSFEFDYVDGKSIITEALINQTTLETFNTLKLIDSNNKSDRESMSSFIKSIKQ